ncbi:MAG: hypothetical protein HONBIEJF_03053 [Fimbriimonadaceae bacterium]|nr:hypothetical protein [Fimbriimonadaceae bacterium]
MDSYSPIAKILLSHGWEGFPVPLSDSEVTHAFVVIRCSGEQDGIVGPTSVWGSICLRRIWSAILAGLLGESGTLLHIFDLVGKPLGMELPEGPTVMVQTIGSASETERYIGTVTQEVTKGFVLPDGKSWPVSYRYLTVAFDQLDVSGLPQLLDPDVDEQLFETIHSPEDLVTILGLPAATSSRWTMSISRNVLALGTGDPVVSIKTDMYPSLIATISSLDLGGAFLLDEGILGDQSFQDVISILHSRSPNITASGTT